MTKTNNRISFEIETRERNWKKLKKKPQNDERDFLLQYRGDVHIDFDQIQIHRIKRERRKVTTRFGVSVTIIFSFNLELRDTIAIFSFEYGRNRLIQPRLCSMDDY